MEGVRTAQTLLRRAQPGLARATATWPSPSASNPATVRLRLLAQPRPQQPLPWTGFNTACARCFSSSTALPAKGGKSAKAPKKQQQSTPSSKAQGEGEQDADEAGRRKPDPENPFDLTDAEEAYARVAVRGEEKLKALRLGGRFNADMLGKLPVTMSKKAGGQTVPLAEMALVDVRQGRIVQLTLFEAEHKKAVLSAIQASDQFNQQPQPDPDDPTILTLKIEAEDLEDQLRGAKDAAHAWREGLRKVTTARQKKHSQWRSQKIVGQDDNTKLDKLLQKMQDGCMKTVETAEENAVRALKKARSNTLDF